MGKVGMKKCPESNPLPVPHEWYQPGDLTIGEIASQMIYFSSELFFRGLPSQKLNFNRIIMVTKFYQHVLALTFAVKEINEDLQILPNVTLGFHVTDSHHDKRLAFRTTLDLLFKSQRFVPNYWCGPSRKLVAIIGGLGSDISFHMADILSLYRIPQLTYGSVAPEKSSTMPVVSFHRMVPNEAHQYMGILQLLLHFGWIWVGLLAVDDDSGDHFLQAFKPLLYENKICSAFIQRISYQFYVPFFNEFNSLSSYLHLADIKANMFVFYGETLVVLWLCILIQFADSKYMENITASKVWIGTAQFDFAVTFLIKEWDFEMFQGSISLAVHSQQHQGFQTYIWNIKPYQTKRDGFLRDFWGQTFGCSFPNPSGPKKDIKLCSGDERLESLPEAVYEMQMTGHNYGVHNAVYAVAHALHTIYSSQLSHRGMTGSKVSKALQPWQLHLYLQGVSFNNSAGETVCFNSKKEIIGGFDITNLLLFSNNSFIRVKVGRVDPSKGNIFVTDESIIVWQKSFHQVPPLSVCSDSCDAGYQKKQKEGEKFCCYDCTPCPDGKISNQKDVTDCFKCPEDQYPNKNKDGCTAKIVIFLSHEEPLGISLSLSSFSFSLITVLVLKIFIKHQDTPIVKANNRDITYILLICLLLSFLSPLLFLGQPNKVTCLLQQPAFGIIFSVVISCILAKTITVIVAFMAIKPGSRIKKWVGKRLTNFIILTCSLLQAGLCVVWLSTDPPVPDLVIQPLSKEIIAECNVGSVLMFYLVLGYMAFLSGISFLVAFLARTLPDTYNEAKFITFSMLMFCSVWFSFILACLSSKGKYMVAVEIFSILASSAGLLGCIFFPKCYIILLRPELNNKEQLTRRSTFRT